MFPPIQGAEDSLRNESFFQPFPQSGLEFIPQGHDDHSRVVVAAGFVRHDDEALGRRGGVDSGFRSAARREGANDGAPVSANQQETTGNGSNT